MENEPRFVSQEPRRKVNHRLRPLSAFETGLDTIVGIVAVLFAILATLGWLAPQLIHFWSS